MVDFRKLAVLAVLVLVTAAVNLAFASGHPADGPPGLFPFESQFLNSDNVVPAPPPPDNMVVAVVVESVWTVDSKSTLTGDVSLIQRMEPQANRTRRAAWEASSAGAEPA